MQVSNFQKGEMVSNIPVILLKVGSKKIVRSILSSATLNIDI